MGSPFRLAKRLEEVYVIEVGGDDVDKSFGTPMWLWEHFQAANNRVAALKDRVRDALRIEQK